MVDGRVVPIVDWVLIPAIDRQGGVNRVVVRVDGGEIRANVNGQDVFTAPGQQVPPGLVGVTAMSWAEPATVSFDNVLVTSAETAQAAPGTSLLRESFEDPSRPLYGALSQAPDQYDFAYVGGILRARRLAENGTAIVLLPYNVDHDHATIAVTARLADQIEGRYLILGCRRHDVPAQTGYRLAVSPVSGTFTIVRWDSDVEVPLISWQESPAIQRDAEWNGWSSPARARPSRRVRTVRYSVRSRTGPTPRDRR